MDRIHIIPHTIIPACGLGRYVFCLPRTSYIPHIHRMTESFAYLNKPSTFGSLPRTSLSFFPSGPPLKPPPPHDASGDDEEDVFFPSRHAHVPPPSDPFSNVKGQSTSTPTIRGFTPDATPFVFGSVRNSASFMEQPSPPVPAVLTVPTDSPPSRSAPTTTVDLSAFMVDLPSTGSPPSLSSFRPRSAGQLRQNYIQRLMQPPQSPSRSRVLPVEKAVRFRSSHSGSDDDDSDLGDDRHLPRRLQQQQTAATLAAAAAKLEGHNPEMPDLLLLEATGVSCVSSSPKPVASPLSRARLSMSGASTPPSPGATRHVAVSQSEPHTPLDAAVAAAAAALSGGAMGFSFTQQSSSSSTTSSSSGSRK